MEVDIPEEGAMGDLVVVVEDLQKRRQDILVEVMVLMEQVICLESVKGVLPDARSIIRCPFNNKLYAGGGGGGGEYSSGSAPGGGGIGYVGDISRRPTNGEPNTGSGGGSFYISGSNVSGGCYSGAGGSGIIILRYMKYK